MQYSIHPPSPQKKGFTLIELSIVLVIIGLIVGGVLVGRDLIRAAELRKVISDIEHFNTSVFSFKTKYSCLPGDCPNAGRFWTLKPDCSTLANRNELTMQTCNGDGDGKSGNSNAFPSATNEGEHYNFWQHLALAGLILGEFTGKHVIIGGVRCQAAGINAPKSPLGGLYSLF